MEHEVLDPIYAPLWKLPTVLSYTAMGRTAWLDGVKKGNMPAPVKMPGTRSVAWRAKKVRAWVEALK
jgi:predicted DNA-binding transcriptional regulator AlpA